jgi:hypothetical protein
MYRDTWELKKGQIYKDIQMFFSAIMIHLWIINKYLQKIYMFAKKNDRKFVEEMKNYLFIHIIPELPSIMLKNR